MKKLIVLTLLVMTTLSLQAQNLEPYVIFNSKGKKVNYQKLMKHVQTKEMVFFGEYHNNAIAHWLQLELTMALSAHQKHQLTLGFEMFEADQQTLMNSYLNNEITEKQFLDSMRMWSNYKTDYKPLVEFAKAHQIPVVASNIPRRIASLTFKKGRAALDSLDQAEYAFMCDRNFPVDTSLSQYKAMLQMSTDHQKGLNFINAQAIKDATMAYFIDKYWKKGTQFIHFNGAYHTDFDQGIIWYLKRLRPSLTYATITTVEQDQMDKLDSESLGKADFIICVKSTVTKTH